MYRCSLFSLHSGDSSELVAEFLAATKVSISASDMTPLFCYIFITLYLFSSSMVVSRVKGRNPVKACFIYGMPAAAVSLSYGVGAVLTSSVENTGISALVNGVMFIVLGIYIVSFSVEMFAGCLTKAEVEIIESLPEDDDTVRKQLYQLRRFTMARLLLPIEKEDDVPASDDSYEAVAQGLSDFVMGYDEEKYDDATIKNENINDGLVLGYGDENQTQPAEKIATEPLKEETAKPVAEAPAEPEIPEEPVYAKRLDVSEEKTEPVKAEAPVKAPVEDTEVSDDRMSEIDRLLEEELEDKK